MSRLRRPLLLAALVIGAWFPPPLRAASSAETRAYATAVKLFQDALYEAAERDCGEFVKQFPDSEKAAEIVLLQGQARLRLKRFDEAAALLAEKAGGAGKLADEFRFWQAEAVYQKGDLPAAAALFGQLALDFPSSPRRLEASYTEAFLRFKLAEVSRVITLLRDPSLPFQPAAKAKPDDPWAARGWLLLAEASLLTGDRRGAEEALASLAGRALPPDLGWQRHFLLARAQLSDHRFAEALSHATNLWTAATNTVPRPLLAEAAVLEGEILENLQQPEAALQAYARNLVEGTPPAQRRQALQRTIEINLRQGKWKETVTRLEAFLAQHPQDEALDVVRLTLGELHLRDYHRLKAAPEAGSPEGRLSLTNTLLQARTQLDLLLTNHPQSQLLGKAQLDRGWCFWEEGTLRLPDGLAAFRAACEKLPPSADQDVARFKWADCQFRTKDFAGALSNYWVVVTNSAQGALGTNTLIIQALYQIVQASLEANDLDSGSAAMTQILARDPEGTFADRTELLVGQGLSRQGNQPAARARYADFAQRFTNSALLPEVKLAIARTYEREEAWPAAIAEYEAWLAAYGRAPTAPTGMVAQAMFDLARLTYQAKPDTNAVSRLTNFVARFPDHTNAPLAQYLVGEYYFLQRDYEKAELHFQDRILFANTNAQPPELAYEARLMAGRAAVAGQRYRSARDYFDWLITNGPLHVAASPIPVSIVAQAYLFRGDTFLSESAEGGTNALARFGEAITAFSKIAERFPTNEYAPLAWGRIGDCHLQLATQDPAQAPKRYENAAEAYRRVEESAAGISARSKAAVGLGIVLTNLAQLKPPPEQPATFRQALDCFLRVFYGKNLREGEQPDPYWVKAAGLAAAELAEAQKQWDQAIGIYRRLQTELPPLRARLDKKIEQAEQARSKAGGVSSSTAP